MVRALAYLRCLFTGAKPPPPAHWNGERKPAPGAASEPAIVNPAMYSLDAGMWGIGPSLMPRLMREANEDRGAA